MAKEFYNEVVKFDNRTRKIIWSLITVQGIFVIIAVVQVVKIIGGLL